MTDRLDFELRLETRLQTHAADVVRPFDAAAIAASAAEHLPVGQAWSPRPRMRSVAWLGLVLLLAAVALAVVLAGSRLRQAQPVLGRFESIGTLPSALGGPLMTATALPDGRVLLAGCPSSLYDPQTRTFAPAASMVHCRTGHAAVLLDDGRVLIVGGTDHANDILASAEVFDSRTGSFSPTGDSLTARDRPSALRLRDGRVLIVGGFSELGEAHAAEAELFDPRTNTFTATGSMAAVREGVTLTLLEDGRVLAAGGEDPSVAPDDHAEIYDPDTGRFTPIGPMSAPRLGFTATRLADGRVLFAGGYTAMTKDGDATMVAAGDLFDPFTGTFSPTGTMVVPRWQHAAALLRDGRVLIVGGTVPAPGGRNLRFIHAGIADAEVFDPATNAFSRVSPMGSPRLNELATSLADGDVLILGNGMLEPLGTSGAELTGELFR
jgi:hypothetical protein